jgi:signal transduction histidine kinase
MSGARQTRILACSLLLLALGGCRDAGFEEARAVRVESLALRQASTPPPPVADAPLDASALRRLGGWQTVTLPDPWDLRRRSRGVAGWYRAELLLPPDHERWSIHVDGVFDQLEVFADGERLGSVSSDEPPTLGDRWSNTLIARLPDDRDRVELMLYFRTLPEHIGGVIDIVAGPRDWLTEATQQRVLIRSVIPNALALVGLAAGLMVLLLARFAEDRGAYWFGVSTSIWCLVSLVPAPPGSFLGWLWSVLAHAFVPAVAVGFHRILGLRRRNVELLLAGTVVFGGLLRAAAPPLLIPAVDVLWWLGNFVIGLYILPLAVQNQRVSQTNGSRWVLFAGVVLMIGGLHDVVSLFAGRVLVVPFSLFVAASPVIAIATAGSIVAALARALQTVRRLNVELEDRVAEKHRELSASYARTAELERERAIATERERMMRDMHDGTGGQLVSALSLVEGGEFKSDDLVETLRAALTDLRLSIDSLETGPPDLLALLALARTRLESRLEHHGVRFAWEVEDVPTPPGFGPEQSLHVLRIFQEAVTNALKHACAKTIAVRTGTARDSADRSCVFVEIADDGRGHTAAAEAGTSGSGRGLRNMRRRAEEIGGECTITTSLTGTTVRLLLPIASSS